jgi:hypothetical protein
MTLIISFPNCTVTYPSLIGDGICDRGIYNVEECGWDGGDCEEFNKDYPKCNVTNPSWYIGNGDCDGGNYNVEVCGWDGGDCEEFNKNYPTCIVGFPTLIGNGRCNGGNYNVEECGWDGGDCAKPSLPNSAGTSFLVPTLQKLVSFSVILHFLWL